MKISIIVPVFNIENYITKCVDSLINQTYENIEILLIDDGSTDNSGNICDDLSKKDNRIKVVHKKNGGLSDARNYGISISKGKYITFIDGDDYIEDKMVENIVNIINSYNPEIIVTNFLRETDDGKIFKEKLPQKLGVCNTEESLRNMLLTNFSACNKFFKINLFKTIKFPVGKNYEDIYTVPDLVLISNKIYFDENYYYHYMQRENSIIHSKFNKSKFNYYYSVVDCSKKLINKNLDEEIDCFKALSFSNLLYDIYISKNEYKAEYKTVYNDLCKICIKKNKYISKSKKIMILLQKFHMNFVVSVIKKIYTQKKYR